MLLPLRAQAQLSQLCSQSQLPVCSPLGRLLEILPVLLGEKLIGREFRVLVEASLLACAIHSLGEPGALQSLFANEKKVSSELHVAYQEL